MFFVCFVLFHKLLYCCSITVVCIFSPPPPPPQPNLPPSPASTLLLGFVHVSFIVVPENPSPHCPLLLPSGYCQIVLNFNVSGYILPFFSFVAYILVKGEIIWYLSLTAWLIPLSIMLSEKANTGVFSQ